MWLFYVPTKSKARKPDSVDRTRGCVFPTQQSTQVICPKDDKHMYVFYRKPSQLKDLPSGKFLKLLAIGYFVGIFCLSLCVSLPLGDKGIFSYSLVAKVSNRA